jgi:hypothetical protein
MSCLRHMHIGTQGWGRGITVVALSLGAVSCAMSAGDDDDDGGDRETTYEISTLSGRPDMVSGGDALVLVSLPAGVDTAAVRLSLDEQDVTSAFRTTSTGALTALVSGLSIGASELTLSDAEGVSRAELSLFNYPIDGPVFSGVHQEPFVCQTDEFELISGETLGTPLDESCSVERQIAYAYRTADGELKPLDPIGSRPADLATVTTLTGASVPNIVRIETGTINRAVYQIAVLHDPAAADPDAWTSSAGWNGRLIYTFGGGCVGGWYRQGATTGGVTDDVMLRQGYAVASSSLNVFGNNCNAVLAAETMMMVKERFVEGYGAPRYTIGWGCSGGSYQNHQIADNYPGLLDGIIPGCSFPDVAFGTAPMITDARLLNRYFESDGAIPFTENEQRAVAGFLTLATMPSVSRGAGRITVNEFCPDALPEEHRYHPVDNPGGARCDMYSHHVNVYGRDGDTGFARRPLDNVGVQYGLRPLNDGLITTAQFLDLNTGIGGYDNDGNFHPDRTVASEAAVQVAYETGRLTSGGGGLSTTPIIDYRAYSDDREEGDVHLRYHSFSMRERLVAANGHADNHVMLVEDDRHGLYSSQSPVLQEALLRMDQWLERLASDTSSDSDPKIERVRRAKPPELVDACWTRDDDPTKLAEPQVRGQGRCEELYPSPPAPREVAGAPLSGNIIKCQLKPVDPSDYAISFSADEVDRLKKTFPNGVCDWSRPGVGQVPLTDTWLSFGTT